MVKPLQVAPASRAFLKLIRGKPPFACFLPIIPPEVVPLNLRVLVELILITGVSM